jgi:WD40 repeat protein
MFTTTWKLTACLAGVVVLGVLTLYGPDQSRSAAQQPGGKQADTDQFGDKLPTPAVNRLGTVRFRHGSRILCMAYSPDGSIIAAGGGDDPVRLWNAQTGKEERTLKDTWTHAIAFSPKGDVLATAGAFKVIQLWNPATGQKLRDLKGHTGTVKTLAFSSDGTLLVSAGQDRVVRVWEVGNGKPGDPLFEGSADEVNAAVFGPQARSVTAGGGDFKLLRWNDKKAPAGEYKAGCAVHALALTPDQKTLASAGDDNTIRLWDYQTMKPLGQLKGHGDTVVSLSFTDNGKTLVSGSLDKTIRLWDVAKQAEVQKIERGRGDGEALAVSPDGKTLAAAGMNNTIRRWQLPEGKEIFVTDGHLGAVTAVVYSSDGKLVASASQTGEIRLWDPTTGKDLKKIGGGHFGDVLLAFAPDNRTLAAASDGQPIRLYGVPGGQETKTIPVKDGEAVKSLAFAPNGKTLAVGFRQNVARLYAVGGEREPVNLAYTGGVEALAFSPDGKRLAGAGWDKVTIWDVTTGQPERQLGKAQRVAALAFASNNQQLAVGNYDATVHVWNVAKDGKGQYVSDAKEPQIFEGHTSAVFSVVFSANNRTLVSGSHDRTVRLWEVLNARPIVEWKGHLGPVTAVSASPLGRTVVSGSSDTTVLVWDVTGRAENGALNEIKLPDAEVENFWKELASEDNPRAQKALWALAAARKQSPQALGKHIYLIDPSEVSRNLEALNSPKFKIREDAQKWLAGKGRWVEGVLDKALEKPPSDEVRRRVVALLEKIREKGGLSLVQERMRVYRFLEVLEQADTADARALLEAISQRGPEEFLRDAARAALERLKERGA